MSSVASCYVDSPGQLSGMENHFRNLSLSISGIRRREVPGKLVNVWDVPDFSLNGPGNSVAVANGVHDAARFRIFAANEVDFGSFPFNGFQKLCVQSRA